MLLYSTKTFKTAPTSWSVLYNKKYAGQITVPDNPIQIADAALYLSKTDPKLGITDPYELTQPQFNATVALLKQEHPLIKKYWDLASQEISLFQSGTTVVGAAWPYQTNTCRPTRRQVADTIPSEGATGWADTWMLATKAPAPELRLQVDAVDDDAPGPGRGRHLLRRDAGQQAGVSDHGQAPEGLCEAYHANEPSSYFQSIKFWKTPLATCDNGKNDCVPFQDWVTAWTQIIG